MAVQYTKDARGRFQRGLHLQIPAQARTDEKRTQQMKGSREHTNDIQATKNSQHLPVTQTHKDRILRRIRRNKHARSNQKPSVAEIVVRIAAALMMIAVCVQAISR